MKDISAKLHEECGIFGIYGRELTTPAQDVYLGLFALQHRGQESCGIAVSDRGVIKSHKDMGLVGEVFNEKILSSLKGGNAVGHVRYSTAGGSTIENCQPLVFRYAKGRFAIAHNGNLTNANTIKNELSQNGAMFQTTADSEIIAQVIARERLSSGSIEQAVVRTMKRIQGAYSLLVLSPQKLVAARDPFGFRPLVIGEKDGSYFFASESCALDAVHARFIRDVEPGEVVVIDRNGLHSIKDNCEGKKNICIFEYIYFARPDSIIDSVGVHESRLMAGAILAQQKPVKADIVIGVPDSGLDAAIGYAKESGIEYGTGFVRNNYVGRTFIKPSQSQRRQSIDIKLTPLSQCVKEKRVVVVDDSIVRGSTSAKIIKGLKEAGALEVHMRICSPTIHWPCYFGTDIPTKKELTANQNSVEQLCELIGADSLDFLDVESLGKLVHSKEKIYCDACFTGKYPYKIKAGTGESGKNKCDSRAK